MMTAASSSASFSRITVFSLHIIPDKQKGGRRRPLFHPVLLFDKPAPFQSQHHQRDQHDVQDDPRHRVREGPGDEQLPAERRAAQAPEDHAGDAPDDAAQDHGADQADVDAPGLLRQQAVQNLTSFLSMEMFGNPMPECSQILPIVSTLL